MDGPHPDTLTAQRAEDVQFYRRFLHVLIEVGVQQAQDVQQRENTTVAQAANAYGQIAQGVRRCIMLARQVTDPAPDPAQHRTAARQRIIRTVEDTIQREATDDDAEALEREFAERLDAPDIDDDITQRPIDEIITEICHDLGLGAALGYHPWKRRTPADIVALRARAAAPRRPAIGATEAQAALSRVTTRFRGP